MTQKISLPVLALGFFGIWGFLATTSTAHAIRPDRFMPDFGSCGPVSSFATESTEWVGRLPAAVMEADEEVPTLDFCSEWNPEFAFNGHRCCRRISDVRKRKKRVGCFMNRPRGDYCGEMTADQRQYAEWARAGKLGDQLAFLERDLGRSTFEQAYCTVNNGFLAHGRQLIPSEINRVVLRSPQRCTEFGTTSMIAMLEWLGRQVGEQYRDPQYARTRLVVGDISAPKGGCLAGPSGRRGHLSHTNGLDVDITFLMALPGRASEVSFHKTFEPKSNWWLTRKILENPYACVKVIFLDRKLIRKLSKAAYQAGDGAIWERYERFLRHAPGHKNHYHVRVGEWPGQAGCVSDARPDLELEEDYDDSYDSNGTFVTPGASDDGDSDSGAEPELDTSAGARPASAR